jgi:hypothetical protein
MGVRGCVVMVVDILNHLAAKGSNHASFPIIEHLDMCDPFLVTSKLKAVNDKGIPISPK